MPYYIVCNLLVLKRVLTAICCSQKMSKLQFLLKSYFVLSLPVSEWWLSHQPVVWQSMTRWVSSRGSIVHGLTQVAFTLKFQSPWLAKLITVSDSDSVSTVLLVWAILWGKFCTELGPDCRNTTSFCGNKMQW